MNPTDILRAPLWALAILGKEKSFVKNPIIGSRRLNELGLHVKRVQLAAAMTARRRRHLARRLNAEQVAEFQRNGFFLVRDFLPADAFKRLQDELAENAFPAREMRQGQTITRMTPMGDPLLKRFPALRAFYNDPRLHAMFQYAASWAGPSANFIETVVADPSIGEADPQTELHEDTFHSSAKFWLYTHDVADDGGPFQYVPGSHLATPQRLEWEYQNSLAACASDKKHHSYGSFRIAADELQALGYPQPQRIVVPGNTLLIGDTYGFHARSVSAKPTTRVSIHGYMRRNPFLPWTGLDPLGLPGIKGRQLDWFLRYLDLREKHLGVRTIWRDVGRCKVADPAHI